MSRERLDISEMSRDNVSDYKVNNHIVSNYIAKKNRMKRKQCERSIQQESGMITVEMCTIMFIFTFAMLAILTFIPMIQTQVFVQNAVNQTAKEVSQYSYLLYRTGYIDMIQDTNKNAEDLKENYDPETLKGNYDKVIVGLEEEPANTIASLLGALSGDGLKQQGQSVMQGFLGMGYTQVFNSVNGEVIGKVTKSVLKDYCNAVGSEDRLESMGVKGGLDEVTIKVEYCTDKEIKNKFKITADYVYVINYPFLDKLEIPCRAVASTAIWGGGVSN